MVDYFLTGGTGILGEQVIKNLLEKENNITVLTRKKDKAKTLEKIGIKSIIGDIYNPIRYKKDLQNSDFCIHMAADVRIGNLSKDEIKQLYITNVLGSKKIFEIFKESSCKQLIYTSTRQIFGNTIGEGNEKSPHNGIYQSRYVHSKYLAHKLALDLIKDDKPVTILIPGTIYSSSSNNGLGNMFRIYCSGQKALMGLNTYNSFLDVEDAGNSIIASMKKEAYGKEYIITNGYTTYDKLYSLCATVSGKKKPILIIPIIIGNLIAYFLKISKKRKNFVLNSEIINNLKNSCKLSNEKSKKELNIFYKPLLPSIEESFRKIYLNQV